MNFITTLFAARWLGAGLGIEAFLTVMAFLYALALAMAGGPYITQATNDISATYGMYAIAPLVMKSILSGLGVATNVLGNPLSKHLRFIGAFVGFTVWLAIAVNLVYLEEVGGFFVFCAAASAFSIRVMAMAWAGVPEPGAPILGGRQ